MQNAFVKESAVPLGSTHSPECPQSVQALSCFYPLWTAEIVEDDEKEEEETGAVATRGPLANGINANAKRGWLNDAAAAVGGIPQSLFCVWLLATEDFVVGSVAVGPRSAVRPPIPLPITAIKTAMPRENSGTQVEMHTG